MSTRAQVVVKGGNGKTLVAIYRHCDGYPSGLGEDLKDLLKDGKIINGISMGKSIPKFFNGIGCMAAWLVHSMKEEIGGVYLQEESEIGVDNWLEYFYTLSQDGEDILMKIQDAGGEVVYDGKISEYDSEKLQEAA